MSRDEWACLVICMVCCIAIGFFGGWIVRGACL